MQGVLKMRSFVEAVDSGDRKSTGVDEKANLGRGLCKEVKFTAVR